MTDPQNKRVLLALSGGVDSSVSAVLLKKAGYDVSAVWMKVTDDASPTAAETSAKELGIPIAELDITEEFSKIIIDDFCSAYHNGLTPNPCVRCNKKIKFGKLVEFARSQGFGHLATGHYIRRIGNSIYKGLDPKKDQSYFLYDIDKDVIPFILFPLGELTKENVRKIAKENGLSAHTRKDSLDICFVPDGDHASLIEKRYPSKPGDVLDINGNVIGTHKGLSYYTIGQRHGFDTKLNDKLYVKSIDTEKNTITVCLHDELDTSSLTADNVSILADVDNDFEAQIKVRYQARPVAGRVRLSGDTAEIETTNPVWAPTPGQSVVFYQDDLLIGGGIIR